MAFRSAEIFLKVHVHFFFIFFLKISPHSRQNPSSSLADLMKRNEVLFSISSTKRRITSVLSALFETISYKNFPKIGQKKLEPVRSPLIFKIS